MKKRFFALLFLLCTAYLLPLASGLIWGKPPFILLSLIFATAILLTWRNRETLKNDSSARNYFFLVTLLCISISAIDLSTNIYRNWQAEQESLFASTDLHLLQKYKPLQERDIHYSDTPSNNPNSGEQILHITTDALGFRNNAHTKKNCDALLIGDSFGVGMCTQDSTISELLYSNLHFNSYNLSVSGNGPWEQFHLLRRELKNISLKKGAPVLWLLFAGNDLEGNYGPLSNTNELHTVAKKIERARDSFFAFREKSPVRCALESLVNGEDKQALLLRKKINENQEITFYSNYAKEFENYGCCNCEIETHKNYTALKATLKATMHLIREKKIPLKIYLLPSKEEVYQWLLYGKKEWTSDTCASPLSKLLSTVATENAVDFYDSKPFLIKESKKHFESEKALLYWHYDTHLNARGNLLIAQYIAATLK